MTTRIRARPDSPLPGPVPGPGRNRAAPVEAKRLASFDGAIRTTESVARPDRYRQLEALPAEAARTVRGGGYSYAAASFGAKTVVEETSAFNRILAFDAETGILECEAGATLGDLHSVLTPKGWSLPAQPGYPRITVGGCVAADVHGKNQFRDGNFQRHVLGLSLFHPAHGVLELDRRGEPELFDLTCGGLGLTGQIRSVRLQLARLEGCSIRTTRLPIARLEETLSLLEEWAPRSRFLYTWHNFSASGESFGRGFLYAGRFDPTSPGEASTGGERYPLITAENRSKRPFSLFNSATTPLFNRAYELAQERSPRDRPLSLFEFLFPVARKVLYFRLFGRPGFHEIQIVVPRESFSRVAARLREELPRFGVPITLASCKLFEGERRHLRFDGSGLCIALDFPRMAESERLAAFLDALVLEAGGLPNIIKDSRLPLATARACYSEGYDDFRRKLRAFDPRRVYRSEISERLEL